jgi:hypothetical protein
VQSLLYCTGAPLIERTESQTAQAKHAAEEQWFAALNSKCKCNGRVPCGDKYKAVLQGIRSSGAMSSNEQRRKLLQTLNTIRRTSGASVCHSSAASAACDHVHMPRELLPRLGSRSTVSPDAFPYLSQTTIDDVRAMRLIRATHSKRALQWAVLQSRLQQYASTGAGTIAEAIVYNDCYWLGQIAHEVPSGAESTGSLSRRNNTNNSANNSSNSSNSSTSSASNSGSSGGSSSSSSAMTTSGSSSSVSSDSSNTAAGATTTATACDSASSRDAAVTHDTTQMYSMAPLHTSVQVKFEPMCDVAAAIAGSGSSTQVQSVAVKQEVTAAVVDNNSSR